MDSIDEETHTPDEFYAAFSNAVYKDDTAGMEEELRYKSTYKSRFTNFCQISRW